MDAIITFVTLTGAGVMPIAILYWHYRTTKTREEQ